MKEKDFICNKIYLFAIESHTNYKGIRLVIQYIVVVIFRYSYRKLQQMFEKLAESLVNNSISTCFFISFFSIE